MVYALYRGDEFITTGTLKEIAKETEIKYRTLMCYKTPSHMNRTKNGVKLIPLEEV